MKRPKPISLKKFYLLQTIAWGLGFLFCCSSVCEELVSACYDFFMFASAGLGVLAAVALCVWLIYNFSHEKLDEMGKEHLNSAHTKSFSTLGVLLFVLICVFDALEDSVSLSTVTLSFGSIADICLGTFALMLALESAFFLIAERNPKSEEVDE